MEQKKTLILGATADPCRYSYLAAHLLTVDGHSIVNVGNKTGKVAGILIERPVAIHKDIDTITLYISPRNQPSLYDYILRTNPKRIIFNPGAENPELEKLANARGIITDFACTLVLLATDQY